ncbi:metallophosphoesterase family protein [Phenylobacterium sp.]|uniref:metallophosphoesterase family protein n=1 Tax=Phenylobacterium sp. TaxID=1871053 RepID=UPI00286E7B35|nr:metallophosphoesterase family protein [Phenylobacterium sp.]
MARFGIDKVRPTSTADRRSGRGTAGELVFAIGDIHGRYDLLKALLHTFAEDYSTRAKGRRPMLIFCGDYIDRGPQSAAVLEALIWLQRHAHLNVRLLMGNHEQALLTFLEDPDAGRGWLEFGGLATLAAYGVEAPRPDAGIVDLIRARDDLLARLPASHLRLLDSLELMVVVGDYAFVHAGIRPGKPLAAQEARDLLGIREAFTDAPGPFEKIIVHGHSWRSDTAEVLGHRVGLDTGAYATGVLSAVRLDGGEVAILTARDPEAAPFNPWAMPPRHQAS